MQDRLHEIIAQCAMIHETNIATDIINDLDAIEEKLSNINSDIKEHYLTLLLQYYFQQNNLDLIYYREEEQEVFLEDQLNICMENSIFHPSK